MASRRAFDYGVAAWMDRAGIPRPIIADSLGVSVNAVKKAVKTVRYEIGLEGRVNPRLSWCPPEHLPIYHTFTRKRIPAAEARAIVERDFIRRGA